MAKVKIPGGDKPPQGPLGRIFEGDFAGAMRMIYPPPPYNSETTARAQQVIQSIERDILTQSHADAEAIERTKEVPLECIKAMAKSRLFALKLPAEWGGWALGQYGYNKVLERLGCEASPFAAYVSAHNSLGVAYPVLHYGTETQKQRLLPEIREWPTGFCFTEQDAGSDPASMCAYAIRVRNSDGSLVGYRLTGKKWYTTNPLRAKMLAVVAHAVEEDEPLRGQPLPDEKQCFCVFIVYTNQDGVTIGPPNDFAGMHGIDNANPEFKDVFVPVENRIGEEGRGFNIALEALNSGRIAVAALASRAIKQVTDISFPWAMRRKQMGPIIGHELTQKRLAMMATEGYAVETLKDFCALRFDAGMDISVEAAMAKMFATEIAWQCIDDTMQIRGGRGYEKRSSLSQREEEASPVERIWRDQRVTRIFEGTTETMTLWSTARGLFRYIRLAKKAEKGIFGKLAVLGGLGAYYADSYIPRALNVKNFPKKLRKHLRYAERASRRLVRLIVRKALRYQKKMEKRQMLAERFCWIAARIFTIALVTARAAEKNNPEEMMLADGYARLAKLDIENRFREANINEDDLMRNITMQIAKKYEG